jgi:hypothetical protein
MTHGAHREFVAKPHVHASAWLQSTKNRFSETDEKHNTPNVWLKIYVIAGLLHVCLINDSRPAIIGQSGAIKSTIEMFKCKNSAVKPVCLRKNTTAET